MPVCMMHLLRAPPLFITQSEAFQTAPHAPFPPPYQPALAGIRSAAHPSGWLQVQVKQRVDNVAGVKIPKYEYIKEAGDSKMDLTGLAAGGQQVSRCKDAYGKTVELLVKLASLQSAFLTLDVAIKTTNRRVNALENVVKPRVANTIAYIKVSRWPALRRAREELSSSSASCETAPWRAPATCLAFSLPET